MPWTCDCCGWENPADDVPSRHRIPCTRCGRPRDSRAETIAELEETIEDLEHDEKSSRSRANNLQDYIRASIARYTGDDLKGYPAIYHRLRRFLIRLEKDGFLISEKGVLSIGLGERACTWWRPTQKALYSCDEHCPDPAILSLQDEIRRLVED